MGGAGTGACPTYLIRPDLGVRGCLHSKAKYDKVIASTGSAFYAKPINGVLSTLDTSAGTHSRYGACDFEADGYSKDVVYAAGRHFRDAILLAYPRLWTGNWHIHVADPSCPNMAPVLAAQFTLFAEGYDALVGNGPDPLGKYRQAEIMAAFHNLPAPVKPAPTVTPGTVKVKDYTYPYTYVAHWYPYPGQQGASYYGPSKAGTAWYSGKTAGGTKTGTTASGNLTLAWVRGHIQRIQKCVGVTVDGNYGPKTVVAVQRWQAAHGLPADGITGPRTWAAMAQAHGQ